MDWLLLQLNYPFLPSSTASFLSVTHPNLSSRWNFIKPLLAETENRFMNSTTLRLTDCSRPLLHYSTLLAVLQPCRRAIPHWFLNFIHPGALGQRITLCIPWHVVPTPGSFHFHKLPRVPACSLMPCAWASSFFTMPPSSKFWFLQVNFLYTTFRWSLILVSVLLVYRYSNTIC
jgi:hypothetical protein